MAGRGDTLGVPPGVPPAVEPCWAERFGEGSLGVGLSSGSWRFITALGFPRPPSRAIGLPWYRGKCSRPPGGARAKPFSPPGSLFKASPPGRMYSTERAIASTDRKRRLTDILKQGG